MTHWNHLPMLDGSRPATDARLAAWLDQSPLETADDAIYTVRGHLEEAVGIVTGLKGMEECPHEDCSRGGDVEYLGDELGKACEGLFALEYALQDASERTAAAAMAVA